MKKLLLYLTAFFVAMSMNAQEESNALTSLLKVNYEGVTPNYLPTGDNPLIVEATPEGLSLNNPPQWDERFFKSMIVLTDDCLTLHKKRNYIVRLTVKVVSGNVRNEGVYRVELGNSRNFVQSEILITANSDIFQVVDVEIPKFPYNVEGDGHIIIKTSHLRGTTILKEVEVLEELTEPEASVNINETNWENAEYFVPDSPEGVWESTAEGLAITNAQMQEHTWEPMTGIANDFSLEKGHNYIVRLTLKVPSDGTLHVGLGNLGKEGTWASYEVPISANDDFQIIDVEFLDFANGVEIMGSIDNCLVMIGSGWIVGTTVIKKVEVIEKVGFARGSQAAIKSVKASMANESFYNLSGQRVDASYKGIVIQNGKKRVIR